MQPHAVPRDVSASRFDVLEISASGTVFAYINVTGADFQCVYFPQ